MDRTLTFVTAGSSYLHHFRGPPPPRLQPIPSTAVPLVGDETLHVAAEVHGAVDLGLLVLHVAHLAILVGSCQDLDPKKVVS